MFYVVLRSKAYRQLSAKAPSLGYGVQANVLAYLCSGRPDASLLHQTNVTCPQTRRNAIVQKNFDYSGTRQIV